jgi:hypothetical protein
VNKTLNSNSRVYFRPCQESNVKNIFLNNISD